MTSRVRTVLTAAAIAVAAIASTDIGAAARVADKSAPGLAQRRLRPAAGRADPRRADEPAERAAADQPQATRPR